MRVMIFAFIFSIMYACFGYAQVIADDFEGNGTINTWLGDDCNINTSFANPFPQGINTSATVLRYEDVGGLYANVRFEIDDIIDLSEKNAFTIKVYLSSNGTSANQPDRISLKLQNGDMDEPWLTQTEIIQPIERDQWQEITFDFVNGAFINLDPASPPPVQRSDFNRVVIQINGENNTDPATAFLDDINFVSVASNDPIYDRLVWADEFDTDGAVDSEKWHHQTRLPNGTSWYNGEIQHYTDRIENSYVEDGILHITAIRENYTDQGETKSFTSARLNSKFAFQYGRVDIRARMPVGIGTWTALWTLGKNISEPGAYWEILGYGDTSWPACGEIDIMEHWGDNQNFVQSAIHTPSSFGNTVNKGGLVLPTTSSEFHVYTLHWYPDRLVFSLDGNPFYTYAPSVQNADTWPFAAEQYIIMNFAILPFIEAGFSSDEMEVDYVRVYQSSPVATTDEKAELFDLKNTPNPAKDLTMISYSLPKTMRVELSIFDNKGERLQTLTNEQQASGIHEIPWDTSDMPSGVYYYTLKAGNQMTTKKCILMK